MSPEAPLQVFHQRAALPVGGEGIDQIRAVGGMVSDLLQDGLLVALGLIGAEAVIRAALGQGKVLRKGPAGALRKQKVRGTGLADKLDTETSSFSE